MISSLQMYGQLQPSYCGLANWASYPHFVGGRVDTDHACLFEAKSHVSAPSLPAVAAPG